MRTGLIIDQMDIHILFSAPRCPTILRPGSWSANEPNILGSLGLIS